MHGSHKESNRQFLLNIETKMSISHLLIPIQVGVCSFVGVVFGRQDQAAKCRSVGYSQERN